MVDSVGSILNFDSGISRVVWDTPGQTGALPDRRQLPPSELAATQQLNRLLLSDNIEAALAMALRPSIASRDILRPDRFRDGLRAAARGLKRALEGASGEDKQALEGLDTVLQEHADLEAALDYYRDMLIAG
jgi:hypothetical protein